MNRTKRRSSLMLVLVIALLALLPLLAVLQYHWLGEVSKGEQERMKSNLKLSSTQFGQDFDREVKNAFIHFQGGGGVLHQQSNSDFVERYRQWPEVSAHPQLIKEIYQTEISANGTFDLVRFNPVTGVFEPVDWPDKLLRLRQNFERQRHAQESAHLILQGMFEQHHEAKQATRTDQAMRGAVIQFSLGPVDDQLPGVIIPLTPFPKPFEEGRLNLPVARAYRIVVFDQDYIKREFIPELARKHFSTGGKSDYNIAVVNQEDAEEVIYQSDQNLSVGAFATPDASETFFKVRIGELDRMVFAARGSESRPNDVEITKKISDEETSQTEDRRKRVAISIVESKINLAEKSPDDFSRSVIKMNSDGVWQVLVKHRAGSLEAAVAGARRRNLAISFGVLLLLGVSVALIVLSSRRVQKLAMQQMEFVAGVSHELRTPLAVICSAGENLADGVVENRDQIKRYGGLIRDEGRRLTEMVEQALEFAGAQSGKRTYKLQPVDLSIVIEDALAACRLQIVEGGFEIDKKTAADLPLVNGDAAALSRAIQNLLGNAIKYSGESRWIGLSAHVVKTANGDEAQIDIIDQGLGVAPSELAHIFEPFYRGKEVSAAQIHGNGLGLSLIKHIVEAHGGRVSVKSNLREGSTFTLSLPVAQGPELTGESTKEDYEQAHFAR